MKQLIAGGPAYEAFLRRMDGYAARGVVLGLERIQAALLGLGSPHRAFVSVQIAGTNGKGSTAAMTEAILRQAGFRTGLFTSPHLARFSERIRIGGREIDGDRLDGLLVRIEKLGLTLSYFELSFLLAMLAMQEDGVEIAVLETGLGGRLDAVTAAEARVAAITSIGFDHTALLGNTLRAIASEKAAIARAGCPLIIHDLPDEAELEVVRIAGERGAVLVRALENCPYKGDDPIPTNLPGRHQDANARIAIAVARAAARVYGRELSNVDVVNALKNVRWPGRLEWVDGVLFDCAHNPDGARALAQALLSWDSLVFAGIPAPIPRPKALVCGISRDKDAAAMLEAWAPCFERLVLTDFGARASSPDSLVALARAAGDWTVEIGSDPWSSLQSARAAGLPICVAGSMFLVGPLRARLLGEAVDPVPTRERGLV